MSNSVDVKTLGLNDLARHIHHLNKRWWTDIKTGQDAPGLPDVRLMLVITELSEAAQAERKNGVLMDDHLPHRRMAEVEMADAYIQLLDFAAGYNFLPLPEKILNLKLPSDKLSAIWKITMAVCNLNPEENLGVIFISMSLAMIREYCRMNGYDLMGAVQEKLDYNSKRHDHTDEARLAPGGKTL